MASFKISVMCARHLANEAHKSNKKYKVFKTHLISKATLTPPHRELSEGALDPMHPNTMNFSSGCARGLESHSDAPNTVSLSLWCSGSPESHSDAAHCEFQLIVRWGPWDLF